MASNPFLDKDGYLNIPEIVALTREIEKEALKAGLKPGVVYFSGKVIPKYDAERAKKLGEAFDKKRAQPIKTRARMPASGSRLKMQVILRDFKNMDTLDIDFEKDFALAVRAIEAHTKLAVKTQERMKAAGAKLREKAGKEFDKNIDCFLEKVLPENFEEGRDYVVGTSMMGKTLLVKLPNGGYVSIGKADAARFEKALDSGNEPAEPKAPARSGRSSSRAEKKEHSSRGSSTRSSSREAGRSSRKPGGRR